jgi:hypothetical protein
MLTKTIMRFGAITILAATMLIAACRKEKDKDENIEDFGYIEDQAQMDQAFDEADDFALEIQSTGGVGQKGGGSTVLSGGCATVTKDTTGTPDSVVIDFGTTNCLCKDGRYRRGKIIIIYNGKYRDSGYYHTVTFSNYYINNNYVYGSRTVTNKGKNSSGKTYFTIAVNGHMVMNKTGDTASHTASRTRTWVAGESTLMLSDDAYEITGSGSTVRPSGKSFTTVITSALYVANNCNWIKSGTIEITPNGATFPRVLDFGSGTCDDKATISVNGKTKNIILK